jgi:hypothetical protein
MTVITKKTTAKEISRILNKKLSEKKIMNMKNFREKLSWKGDALKIQKKMRDDLPIRSLH